MGGNLGGQGIMEASEDERSVVDEREDRKVSIGHEVTFVISSV